MSEILKKKIKMKNARVAVIGLGYVGLPLAVAFARKGFHVVGIDKDARRVERIINLKSYISDVTNEQIGQVIRKGKFSVSTDFDLLNQSDVVLICVPTPIKRKYTPDISYIISAVNSIAAHMHKDMLVVLESTTYPGTTQELIKPALEKSGLKVGKDFYLSFSPERIDPGNSRFDVTQIPKVVGGLTPACTKITTLLYQQIINQVHEVSSAKSAEMTKLLENSFRIVNIAWINEIAQMCHKLGIDVWEVIEAAKSKPFGFMPFYPGLGVGGHCIPEDPLYLYWKAKNYGFNARFIKLSADINADMPNYALRRLGDMLSKPLDKAKVLVLGVTYKKDVKDLRKSPSIKLIELLKKASHVDYYDPLVPYLDIDGLKVKAVSLKPAVVKKYDVVVVAVDHAKVNYGMVRRNARLIFDVKNIYQGTRDAKIIKL